MSDYDDDDEDDGRGHSSSSWDATPHAENKNVEHNSSSSRSSSSKDGSGTDPRGDHRQTPRALGANGGTLADLRVSSSRMKRLIKEIAEERFKYHEELSTLTSHSVEPEIKPLLEVDALSDIANNFDKILSNNLDEVEADSFSQAEADESFKSMSDMFQQQKEIGNLRVMKVMGIYKESMEQHEKDVQQSIQDLKEEFDVSVLQDELMHKYKEIDKISRAIKEKHRIYEFNEELKLKKASEGMLAKVSSDGEGNEIMSMMEEEAKKNIEKLTQTLADNDQERKEVLEKIKFLKRATSASIVKLSGLMQSKSPIGGDEKEDLSSENDMIAMLDMNEPHHWSFQRPKSLPILSEFISSRKLDSYGLDTGYSSSSIISKDIADVVQAIDAEPISFTNFVTDDEVNSSGLAIRQQVKETSVLNEILTILEAKVKMEKEAFEEISSSHMQELNKLKLACDNYDSSLTLVHSRLDEIDGFINAAPANSFLLKNSMFSSMRRGKMNVPHTASGNLGSGGGGGGGSGDGKGDTSNEADNLTHFNEAMKLVIRNPEYMRSKDSDGTRGQLRSKDKVFDILQIGTIVRAVSNDQQGIASEALDLLRGLGDSEGEFYSSASPEDAYIVRNDGTDILTTVFTSRFELLNNLNQSAQGLVELDSKNQQGFQPTGFGGIVGSPPPSSPNNNLEGRFNFNSTMTASSAAASSSTRKSMLSSLSGSAGGGANQHLDSPSSRGGLPDKRSLASFTGENFWKNDQGLGFVADDDNRISDYHSNSNIVTKNPSDSKLLDSSSYASSSKSNSEAFANSHRASFPGTSSNNNNNNNYNSGNNMAPSPKMAHQPISNYMRIQNAVAADASGIGVYDPSTASSSSTSNLRDLLYNGKNDLRLDRTYLAAYDVIESLNANSNSSNSDGGRVVDKKNDDGGLRFISDQFNQILDVLSGEISQSEKNMFDNMTSLKAAIEDKKEEIARNYQLWLKQNADLLKTQKELGLIDDKKSKLRADMLAILRGIMNPSNPLFESQMTIKSLEQQLSLLKLQNEQVESAIKNWDPNIVTRDAVKKVEKMQKKIAPAAKPTVDLESLAANYGHKPSEYNKIKNIHTGNAVEEVDDLSAHASKPKGLFKKMMKIAATEKQQEMKPEVVKTEQIYGYNRDLSSSKDGTTTTSASSSSASSSFSSSSSSLSFVLGPSLGVSGITPQISSSLKKWTALTSFSSLTKKKSSFAVSGAGKIANTKNPFKMPDSNSEELNASDKAMISFFPSANKLEEVAEGDEEEEDDEVAEEHLKPSSSEGGLGSRDHSSPLLAAEQLLNSDSSIHSLTSNPTDLGTRASGCSSIHNNNSYSSSNDNKIKGDLEPISSEGGLGLDYPFSSSPREEKEEKIKKNSVSFNFNYDGNKERPTTIAPSASSSSSTDSSSSSALHVLDHGSGEGINNKSKENTERSSAAALDLSNSKSDNSKNSNNSNSSYNSNSQQQMQKMQQQQPSMLVGKKTSRNDPPSRVDLAPPLYQDSIIAPPHPYLPPSPIMDDDISVGSSQPSIPWRNFKPLELSLNINTVQLSLNPKDPRSAPPQRWNKIKGKKLDHMIDEDNCQVLSVDSKFRSSSYAPTSDEPPPVMPSSSSTTATTTPPPPSHGIDRDVDRLLYKNNFRVDGVRISSRNGEQNVLKMPRFLNELDMTESAYLLLEDYRLGEKLRNTPNLMIMQDRQKNIYGHQHQHQHQPQGTASSHGSTLTDRSDSYGSADNNFYPHSSSGKSFDSLGPGRKHRTRRVRFASGGIGGGHNDYDYDYDDRKVDGESSILSVSSNDLISLFSDGLQVSKRGGSGGGSGGDDNNSMSEWSGKEVGMTRKTSRALRRDLRLRARKELPKANRSHSINIKNTRFDGDDDDEDEDENDDVIVNYSVRFANIGATVSFKRASAAAAAGDHDRELITSTTNPQLSADLTASVANAIYIMPPAVREPELFRIKGIKTLTSPPPPTSSSMSSSSSKVTYIDDASREKKSLANGGGNGFHAAGATGPIVKNAADSILKYSVLSNEKFLL